MNIAASGDRPQAQKHGHGPTPVIAVIGNPNIGKSTLFNQLTGLRQKIANFPGVTVEKHVGTVTLTSGDANIVDLPGTYSLSANSPDEMIVADVLYGQVEDTEIPDMVLVVVDASTLRRNLFLVSQVIEAGLPTVVALNMVDVAEANGINIDVERLGAELGVRVIPVNAARGQGIDAVKGAMVDALQQPHLSSLNVLPDVRKASAELARELRDAGNHVEDYEVERALVDAGGYAEQRLQRACTTDIIPQLEAVRERLSPDRPLGASEAHRRYAWINALADEVETSAVKTGVSLTERLDAVVSHPLAGSVLFVLVMAIVFQSVFAWATPLMDSIDAVAGALSDRLNASLPEGALTSLLVDGVIAGVGSVVIFLPQILILFAFIIVLEDSGYMARAAFMMDRVMRACGLSGTSFVPMLSSFACAVPGIMATRIIPNRRDRIATILAAPFMTCSARLPVYALLISAFVPQQTYLAGIINLQGMVLFGLYLLGIVGGVTTAWLFKRTALRGPTPSFLMELPPYRLPNLKSLLIRLWERARIFLVRAGTVIFSVAVIIWALVYFPHPQSIQDEVDMKREIAALKYDGEVLAQRLNDLDNQQAAAYLEQSYLGRIGKTIEPIFRPLGWDWKVSSAVVASFPAREVVIAVMGTIYAVGGEVDEESAGLRKRITAATWPDGSKVFTLPMVIGLLVFYAFCLQCVATVAAIGRETDSWRWPVIAWVYMTALGYAGAFLVVQLGSAG